MRHCSKNVSFYKKWFLKDTENFTNRCLEIAYCCICNNQVIQLTETRKSDNALFVDVQSGKKAKSIITRVRKKIDYTVTTPKNYSGWIYGVNKERRNKRGKITSIKQYAYDYSTSLSKGLVKTILR